MADGSAHLKQGLVRVRHHCIDMSIFHAPLLRMLLIAAALTTTGYPQQKPEDVPPSIKVEVNLVNVLASVRDRHGALISNLTKDDFQIFEDGKQQEIKYFARETDLPLTIGLLVDVSASQQNLIEIERRAAYEF